MCNAHPLLISLFVDHVGHDDPPVAYPLQAAQQLEHEAGSQQSAGQHEMNSAPMDTSSTLSDSQDPDYAPSSSSYQRSACTDMLAESRLSMQAGPEQIVEDHNDAWQGMWKLLLGSDEYAQAAGLPSAPTDISSSSLLHKLQSMRIIYNPESC